jgi:hypothetical protein
VQGRETIPAGTATTPYVGKLSRKGKSNRAWMGENTEHLVGKLSLKGESNRTWRGEAPDWISQTENLCYPGQAVNNEFERTLIQCCFQTVLIQ